MIIYQIFTRLFGNDNTTRQKSGTLAVNGCGKLNDITPEVLRKIRTLGVSHIWYTGLIRHATQTDYSSYGIPQQHAEIVKGKAGSPYAIADYYDVDPDLATQVEHRMEECEALIARTHKAGLKVVMDFVPNHVAREYHSICKPDGVKDLGVDDRTDYNFSPQNNFYYCWGQPLDLSAITSGSSYREQPAKATGNDQFTARPGSNDWYETVKLNYGIDYCDAGGRSEHFDPRPDTWTKMRDILLFWCAKGIDAFRCDMAEMVPPQFWAYATREVRQRYPEVQFIGEVYNPALYRTYIKAGFDFLYDKVGMYDCLRDVIGHRRPAADITQQWQQTDDIGSHMLYFLENHDEQRLASDFFAGSARKGIPALIVAALLKSCPFMLYAGQEVGERGMDDEGFSGRDGRTTIFDYWSLDSLIHEYSATASLTPEESRLHELYSKVLKTAATDPAAVSGESFDLMYANSHLHDRQFAFLRKQGSDTLLVVANFDDKPVSADVMLPGHAFDYLGMKELTTRATELLTRKRLTLKLKADAPLLLSVPAWSGLILKFKS